MGLGLRMETRIGDNLWATGALGVNLAREQLCGLCGDVPQRL